MSSELIFKDIMLNFNENLFHIMKKKNNLVLERECLIEIYSDLKKKYSLTKSAQYF